MRRFEWTEPRRVAVELVFKLRGRSTLAEIAGQLGVCRRTLFNWRHSPEFIAKYDEMLVAYGAELRREMMEQVRDDCARTEALIRSTWGRKRRKPKRRELPKVTATCR